MGGAVSFLVVAYDVREDRRRARLHRRLKSRLPRPQKSVFEGPADRSEVEPIRAAIRRSIDPETDTVRVYHLCPRCRERTEHFGTAEVVPEEAEDVVVDG